MKEEWKKIEQIHRLDKSTGIVIGTYDIRKGYEYKISNLGNILRRKKNKDWAPISTSCNKHGYRISSIQLEDGIKNKCNAHIHRLVAEHFLDPPEDSNKRWVNHKDGDKSNPEVSNLEWATRSDNAQHALDNGLMAIGERSGHAIMTDDDVHLICKYLERGYSPSRIEKLIGEPHIKKKNISKIRSKTRWVHVSDLYDFTQHKKEDFRKGEGRPNSKLTERTVHKICIYLAQKTPPNIIKKRLKLDISESTIINIKQGRSWTNISKLYYINKF
jgi:hypothetical protein